MSARPSAHLLGCFQLLGVEFVYDLGFGAYVIVAFVGHKADVGVICGLWTTLKTLKQEWEEESLFGANTYLVIQILTEIFGRSFCRGPAW